MTARRSLAAVLVLLAALHLPRLALAQAAPGCQFVLGFATLADLIPDVVGQCTTNETHNPVNGDALQQTTSGLLVWRRADNFTAFTDGSRSWIDGPYGLRYRWNTQRFAWEADAGSFPAAPDWPTTGLVSPYGYSFTYPSEWTIQASSLCGTDQNCATGYLLKGSDPATSSAPSGSTTMELIISGQVSPTPFPVSQIVAAHRPGGSPPFGDCGNAVLARVVTIAGQSAARIDFQSCRSVAIQVGLRTVTVLAGGNTLPFDAFAASVRVSK